MPGETRTGEDEHALGGVHLPLVVVHSFHSHQWIGIAHRAQGAHSGGEIHKERANAISILARYLDRLPSFQIASIAGGTRRNVIPFSAEAVITVSNKDAAISQAKTLQEELSEEFKLTDPGIKLTVTGMRCLSMATKETVHR